MMSSPSSQSGDTSGNHQTQPKKRSRKGPKGKATPATPRLQVSILGESVFSPEDFAAGMEHFKKISTSQSLEDDDLSKMRDFLTWGDDEQRKWLAKLSPEQFGVVLFAEKLDRDNQQSVVAQRSKVLVAQPQNDGAASSFGNQLQQINGVQNFAQDQHVQNMMTLNNMSSFNQQFSLLAQNATFQQMAFQNTQGQSARFGTHIPTFIVCPSGQLIPQQQDMFGNMTTMPNYQSSNMQIPGAYQQQIIVNGQLMNVALQPAIAGHQGGQFNSHQLMSGAHDGYSPQQHGVNVNHGFNSMGQQNRTTSYSLPSGGQPNNSSQGANYVLPALSHAARVAEAQLRAATMRRQHAELRARGLPVPNLPNHPMVPPLVMSGPGLGNLQGAIDNLPSAPRSCLLNAFEGINWEKDPEKDATAKGAMVSPPNNSLGGHTPTGDGFPMKFADVSGVNPVFLSQMGNATMVNGRSTGNSASTTTSGAVGYHGVNGPSVSSYQVQLPNSAGQLSLGPNAQGSIFPAGAAKGITSKTSPKSKKTTKKNFSAASSSAVSNVANALFPSSSSVTSTSQANTGTAQPNPSFSIVQNPGYSHGSQTNPISLDMPAPRSAITHSAVKSFASKLAFPSLPSPELSPVVNTSSSRVEPCASQASATAPTQTTESIIPSLEFSETNMAVDSTSSEPDAAVGSSSTHALESADEVTHCSVSAETEFNISEFDELFASIATPELEPSTPNGPPTPEDSQPTDFGNDSLDGFFDFLDTPGVASSGEYVGVGVYDETQPVGLGFDMSGDQFDPMADTDFTDTDFASMGFDNWTSFESAQ